MVYLAQDTVLDREVAIKVVTPAALNPATSERFRREARVVARMDHPAIVGLYDIGEHDDSMYIVMPFVPGKNLRAFIKERNLRIKDVVDVGIQVAEALEYSHLRGVIHRDIKPENIMVSQDLTTNELRVRITDFGLAVPTSESRITQSGALVGTIGYISPEQLTQGEVDARTDVYSLGTVLYECVVGDTPFSGELLAVLYRITHENPQPPRALGAQIPEEMEAIILRCLEKIPERRPQRAGELAEELMGFRSRIQEDEAIRVTLDSTHRPTMQLRPTSSPLIGREDEFAELQRRLNASAAGESQFAVIGGEAGIGKSRLLEEVEKLASVRKFRVLHGRFAEQQHTFPYKGFCDLFQDYFHAKIGSTSGISADFSDLMADLIALFPMLSELDPNRPSPPPDSSEGKRFQDRTYVFEILARTLNRICGGKPMVILLEDLHAADVSIDALQYVAHRLIAAPIFILATFRTTEVDKSHPLVKMMDTFQGDKRFVLIFLQPFSPTEHRRFVEALSGFKVEDSLAEKLFGATDGNPYFTKELYRSLLDSKIITKTRTNFLKLSGGDLISSQSLPATIQQTVKRRVERLPKDLHQILSIASVLGKTFTFRDLEILNERTDMEDAVDTLVEEGFLEEERDAPGDRLTFSSSMIRDVLYAALPPRRRRLLHRRYAQDLEHRNAGRLDRVYGELVHHYSNGDVAEKVIEYGMRLAQKSLAAFSAEDAARAARSVLDFVEGEEGSNPLLESEVRALLAESCRMMGDIDTALREIEDAIQILEAEKRPADAVKMMMQAVEIAWEGRRFDHTRMWVEKGIPAARLIRDHANLAKFLSIAATVANLAGEHEKAGQYQEEHAFLQNPAGEELLQPGGSLTIALPAPINAHHPANIRVDEEYELFANVFETLIRTDAQGNIVPFLCERWEPLDQGRSFLFTVRSGVRFQDGSPLSSQTVRDALQTSIKRSHPDSMPAALAAIRGVREFLDGSAGSVAGLQPFSEQKLGIELSERLPLYPAMFSDVRTAIAGEGSKGIFVGTGPFQIVSQDPHCVVLKRNPDYWKKELPFLDELEFRSSLTSKEIAGGVRSGIFDLARDLPPEDLEEIINDSKLQASLVEAAEKNVYFLLWNTSRIADQELRRALNGLVSSPDLVRRTLGRVAQPAEGLIPPGILGHDPGIRRLEPSPEDCVKTIAPFLPLKLNAAIHPIFQDRYSSLTESMVKMWTGAGVEISLVTDSMESFLDSQQNNENIDFMIGRWIADYDDPDNFTYGLFHSSRGSLRKYFSSKQIDLLMESARVEGRSAVREKSYRQIQTFLLEADFLLPLFHDIDYRIANHRIKRLKLQNSPPYVNYSELARQEDTAHTANRKGTGGTISIPVARELPFLDPSLAFTAVSGEILPNIFETLTRCQAGAQIVPWLASQVIAEDSGRRYRFRLREDARFHDSRKLTARDVRYSFERLLTNPASKSRWMLLPIRGANSLFDGSEKTLEGFHIHSSIEFTIELDQQLSFFPALLTFPGTAIVPEDATEFQDSWRNGCIGTGPFRVVRFESGRLLELEANPYYWRRGYPKNEGLVFSFGVSPTETISGFRAGRFSLASDVMPADVETLRHDPHFAAQYRESPRLSTEYVMFNIHQGPLKDESIRSQLRQSVDVEAVVRKNLGRVGLPAHSLIPPGMLGYEPSKNSTPVRKGRVPGTELIAAISPRHQGRYEELARDIFAAFEETGARIQVLTPSESEYANILATGSVDLAITGWNADYPDADTFAHGVLHSQQGADGKFCGTREIDRFIGKARTETDPALRHQFYCDIEEILASRSILLPLFHEQTYRFARPEVEGLELNFFAPTVDYPSLWVRW